MNPAIIKQRIWNLALRMDPQTGTLNVRTPATTVGEPDTFTTYNLLRLTYSQTTDDQLTMLGASLADQYKDWTVYQVDLDNSGAPQPQPKYTLTINGQTWIVERVQAGTLNQAWICTSRLKQPA